MMKKISEPKNEILLIGDTKHDFEIANEIGVDSILISSGHQEKAKLLELGVPVVDKLREVPEYL